MGKRKKPGRKVAIFVSLVGMVAFTTVLLFLLAPPPLTSSIWRNLFAFESEDSAIDGIFKTEVPAQAGRWTYIYIHHSKTTGGDAETIAQNGVASDHFVIGNGDGCDDGQVQLTQLWNHQLPVTKPPAGIGTIEPHCICICVIGDFDHSVPTAMQTRRLALLVSRLQSELQIPASQVKAYDLANTPAGIGHLFPLANLKSEILQ